MPCAPRAALPPSRSAEGRAAAAPTSGVGAALGLSTATGVGVAPCCAARSAAAAGGRSATVRAIEAGAQSRWSTYEGEGSPAADEGGAAGGAPARRAGGGGVEAGGVEAVVEAAVEVAVPRRGAQKFRLEVLALPRSDEPDGVRGRRSGRGGERGPAAERAMAWLMGAFSKMAR